MIENLKIEHFKSIESLDIHCNRINIFIGAPNTGKSNILEALSLFTFCEETLSGSGQPLSSFVRFRDLSNLFTDGVLDHDVHLEIRYNSKLEKISIQSKQNGYTLDDKTKVLGNNTEKTPLRVDFDFFGNITGWASDRENLSSIKYYLYKEFPEYINLSTDSLKPPFGENLVALVQAHKPLRQTVSNILKAEGYRLLVKPHGKQFEIIKDMEDVSFGYPYTILSDSLKRIIFYTLAIQSNNGATLVLEEPESYTFPYYTKHLAEEIAMDERNQYFIATHNPYLLRSVIEKAPKGNVNIFVTTLKDYLTVVTQINPVKIPDLLDSDPFFNLPSFIEEEGG